MLLMLRTRHEDPEEQLEARHLSKIILQVSPLPQANSLQASNASHKMITKHITEVTTKFNPFKKPAKTCRVFLAHLPANARQNMKITTKVLGRGSTEPSSLKLKFSEFY